ncbi:serine O-acetyltransferase [Gilvimarinus agarilyticus]|uniref:serine O-acetyltransferase n=1 Tax=unclassified Gilvimarinus TaxID=2642066 RepID=UPI001C09E520|nr:MULTISPECIES: serine O-acetyltransferase [unclassified Gilvimarinus]MBU2885332.1 serine O-acetyltransferase [Gilvimarinus agarilyticus]MDO6570231.1 serine O-acetyltransferase [Gilvimarinus sp. 2_MG-2023]MDO6748226.1 serine O-acetyltransferase [Gilvimarinus sp. 1_MG-2023]
MTTETAAASADPVWDEIRERAFEQASQEPMLASFLYATILNHHSLEDALSFHLANKLESQALPAISVREVIDHALAQDSDIGAAVRADIQAINERDSASCSLTTPFLFFKGFHALQAYRVAHWLWKNNRHAMALFLQNRISMVFSVDIHPAAQIGRGIMLDHGTGIVIGETAVVEDDVSIMQAVTLGGTGKETGDRHPKVRSGVLISAGAKILGNIEIGHCAKVGAGSVVLHSVPARTTVAGVPAKVVGSADCSHPSRAMNHTIEQ